MLSVEFCDYCKKERKIKVCCFVSKAGGWLEDGEVGSKVLELLPYKTVYNSAPTS